MLWGWVASFNLNSSLQRASNFTKCLLIRGVVVWANRRVDSTSDGFEQRFGGDLLRARWFGKRVLTERRMA